MESPPSLSSTPPLSRGTVDPAAHRRTDEVWLKAAWSDPRTRVLVLEAGDPGTHGWQALQTRQSVVRVWDGPAGPELVFLPPQEAPAGEWYFLGQDAEERAYIAVRVHPGDPADTGNTADAADGADPHQDGPWVNPAARREGTRPASLRAVGPLLGARDSGLLTHAVALGNWHATHQFCPRCGAATRVRSAGHVRQCTVDGSEHFPRLDPAVIMLVHDPQPDVDRCLLAHNPQWPDNRYSVLAGYVEPGESLEQAVVREVAEEVGVAVTQPHYLGSQPWPFPRSLMLGFTARAAGTTLRTDHTEIERVRWFTRAELATATQQGTILLPGRSSIARGIIEHWYGGALPGE
ncbi:NAD(+) diphosphatase [Lipingzhangella sp. LS1_29]|uniref:NAD(+) diphosphatase n=1 Tax=Lipingzhangella rawalii TaxID=2055835 RepID=A0ABU2HB49_9ACTN|nr:NAD(+) diphosphatase [Lipingzhangella rawalii]MDS1272557.1 NAD(+) diphosphatase [Lipingzhangella rawalii]